MSKSHVSTSALNSSQLTAGTNIDNVLKIRDQNQAKKFLGTKSGKPNI